MRGSDRYHHFLPEPAPQSDFHPDALAFHAKMLAANDQILYQGTPKQDGGSSHRGRTRHVQLARAEPQPLGSDLVPVRRRNDQLHGSLGAIRGWRRSS